MMTRNVSRNVIKNSGVYQENRDDNDQNNLKKLEIML